MQGLFRRCKVPSAQGCGQAHRCSPIHTH